MNCVKTSIRVFVTTLLNFNCIQININFIDLAIIKIKANCTVLVFFYFL